MASHPKTFYTAEEYLRLEREADFKSEYFNGQIFAMARAIPEHILIVGNVVTQLNLQLRDRPCTVYSTDLRVRVSHTGLYTYPDVVVMHRRAIYSPLVDARPAEQEARVTDSPQAL